MKGKKANLEVFKRLLKQEEEKIKKRANNTKTNRQRA